MKREGLARPYVWEWGRAREGGCDVSGMMEGGGGG
jgi:hypothetical protein